MTAERLVARSLVSSVWLMTALALGQARAAPPDSATEEALSSGVWHVHVGEDDYLYELTLVQGRFGGHLHRVSEGRHINQVPVAGGVVREGSVVIVNRGLAPFRGSVNLDAARIHGGVAGAPGFSDVDLVREDAAAWPMIRPCAEPSASRVATPPEALDDGWLTSDLGEVGIEPSAVGKVVEAICAGRAGAVHSLLVARDGRLVAEEYFHGWSREDLHHTASVTKSVASLLVGIAIDHEQLDGVEAPILEFFPEIQALAGRGWEGVRLEHLLTMSMGLDWSDREALGWPPLEDQYRRILSRNVEVSPGARFRYVSRNVNLLSRVLFVATGVEADVFASRRLFEPLGIERWDWELRRWEGHPDLAAALKLRPRDLLKLGQLVMDDGIWDGRRVVSARWIRESTRTRLATDMPGLSYGYLWWRMDPPPADFPFGIATFALGMGSQYVLIVPEAHLVVVTTGGNDYSRIEEQDAIRRLVLEELIPGVHAAAR